MQIGKNEIDVKFTVREAQSLLMVLRRINEAQGRSLDMCGLPPGVEADMRGLQMEFENVLLMDSRVGG